MKKEVKPGYKTTEFWITVVAVITGLLAASGLIAEGTAGAKVIGVIIEALAAMGYTIGRSIAKK